MTVLLDTHVFLWWVEGAPRFSRHVLELVEQPEIPCLVSVASCWGMAIKVGLGKLRLAGPVRDYVPRHLAANNFKLCPISLSARGQGGEVGMASPRPF